MSRFARLNEGVESSQAITFHKSARQSEHYSKLDSEEMLSKARHIVNAADSFLSGFEAKKVGKI